MTEYTEPVSSDPLLPLVSIVSFKTIALCPYLSGMYGSDCKSCGLGFTGDSCDGAIGSFSSTVIYRCYNSVLIFISICVCI